MTVYRTPTETDETWVFYGSADDSRLEVDVNGIRAYDDAGNLVVNIDAAAAAHLLVGTISNGLSGDRILIDSSSLNQILATTSGVNNYVLFTSTGILLAHDSLVTGNYAKVSSTALEIFASEINLNSGKQARGYCSWEQRAAEVLGTGARGYGVTYGGVSKLTNVPSSISFSTEGTDSNVASVGAADITNRGFRYTVTPTATGAVLRASRTIVTVGA